MSPAARARGLTLPTSVALCFLLSLACGVVLSQPVARPLLHFPEWRHNAHWWAIVPAISALQAVLVAAALAKGFRTPHKVAIAVSAAGLATFLTVQLLRYGLAVALLLLEEREAAQQVWHWMDPTAWFAYVWGGRLPVASRPGAPAENGPCASAHGRGLPGHSLGRPPGPGVLGRDFRRVMLW